MDKKKKVKQEDQTEPTSKWEFNEEVTKVFENMLERSIPQYQLMRELCFKLGSLYVKQHTDILDLGCSKGDALSSFVTHFGAHNRFTGIDVSKPMLEAARKKFEHYINTGIVNIREVDLREDFPKVNASLILSVLTIQFTPIEYRQNIIQRIYDSLETSGAFIFVEKVLGNSAEIDRALIDIYYGMKAENAYTQKQIESKRRSLEGVLVPVTTKMNEEMLRTAGFHRVDCFWRCLNFAGWIAIK